MTTTRADLEAVLPPSDRAGRLSELADRVADTEALALRSLLAYGRAWRAADGCRAGAELRSRIDATTEAGIALRGATYAWMDAKSALSAAMEEEG